MFSTKDAKNQATKMQEIILKGKTASKQAICQNTGNINVKKACKQIAGIITTNNTKRKQEECINEVEKKEQVRKSQDLLK